MSNYLPTVFGENLMDVFDDFDRNFFRGFGNVDHALYGDPESTLTRDEVVEQMADYVDLVQEREPLAARTAVNHLMGLALGLPGARHWRRLLTDPALWKTKKAGEIVRLAWKEVKPEAGMED